MTKKIHVFTSAACNYIPKTRLLFESIKKYHPDWVIHLALADKKPDKIDFKDEIFDEVHVAENLGIKDFQQWSFCHDLVELATAIR